MNDIRLIATDLDGTLIGPQNEFTLYDSFGECVEGFRRESNTLWAVCTGRTLNSYKRIFSLLRRRGITPDFVIVRHAYMYSVYPRCYLPHVAWNFQIRQQIRAHTRHIRRTFTDWESLITTRFPDARTTTFGKDRLTIQFKANADAAMARDILRQETRTNSMLTVFQYLQEVDVRRIPVTKAMALTALCAHLDIPGEEVLVVGDGHNDLSMMEPTIARYTGCPANSNDEVIELVHARGGHIASKPYMEGVIEVLHAYEHGKVHSALPAGWVPPALSENPDPPKKKHRKQMVSAQANYRRSQRFKTMLLAGSGLGIALFVLAYFRVLPKSDLIMKPFAIAGRVFGRLVDAL
jgi:HAD superfamily hydrolase (TIGR01484 family)